MPSTRGLQPAFKPIVDELLDRLQRIASGFVITSSVRTETEQAALYAKYLAGGEGVYTVLPPGRSQHERGWAVDIARIGTPPKEDPLLAQVGAWWRSRGGVWGGRADPVHFEAPKFWTGRS